MSKSAIADTFDVSHLPDEARTVAETIVRVIAESKEDGKPPYSGGNSKVFATPEGADVIVDHPISNKAILVVFHDGGDAPYFFNYDYESYDDIEKMRAALEEIGYYTESPTCWYATVYRIPE
jgi:hypothetical protein